jgi:hypothetical protein
MCRIQYTILTDLFVKTQNHNLGHQIQSQLDSVFRIFHQSKKVVVTQDLDIGFTITFVHRQNRKLDPKLMSILMSYATVKKSNI